MNKIPNLYVLPSIFAITLSIYFRTLYPTIAGGDRYPFFVILLI